ncbi:MAG: SDR family NAD(P)-dependent oxidoreductase [Pseudomonadota bacterium]
MRSVLITGCSSGIGYDAALTLSKRGWRVFATCRTSEDCERLRADGLESFVLDYEDEDTIAAAVDEALGRTGGTLDAVFNNGAYAIPGLVEDLPRDALRAAFEANLFGPVDLANRLMPTFVVQGHGRIVQCSSVLGFIPARVRGAYVATKHALEGITDCMRLELRGQPVHISLIEPGPIPTRFRINSQPQFERWIDVEGSRNAEFYRDVVRPRLYDESGTPDRFELPASAVTARLIHALEAPRPRARYYVTAGTWLGAVAKRALPTALSDRIFVGL